MRYLLELSFNGANYHGWQIQPNSVSVQETIERCLSTILNEKINIVGAGRTDSGVHASYFCAHFDYDQIIKDKSNFIYKSNSFLPKDISINKIYVVKSDFHARFDAVSRTYQYRLNTFKNPFLSNNSYYLRKDINFYKMNLAALKLYNYKDFKSFSKSIVFQKCKFVEMMIALIGSIFILKLTGFTSFVKESVPPAFTLYSSPCFSEIILKTKYINLF